MSPDAKILAAFVAGYLIGRVVAFVKQLVKKGDL